MRRRRHTTTAGLCLALVAVAASAHALEVRVTQMRAAGPRLAASVEVQDLLRDKFLALLRGGRSIFLQLEADFWEDRRVFDRIVLAVPAATWRVDPDPDGSAVILLDQHGGSARHADIRQPLALRVDIGPASRLQDDSTYYVHLTLTAATVDQRDLDRAGAAIFGDDASAGSLAAVGRFVFRTLLRMGTYFESATAEVTSRRMSGRALRAAAP